MRLSDFLTRSSVAFAALILSSPLFGQTLNPPKVESPNVASLGTFGEIPVDMYTGTPNISIPLYNLTCGKIDLPINLRYHPSNVKPSQQPSWVGSGWDLECGGAITRIVRGLPDEAYIDPTANPNAAQPIPYYAYPGETTTCGSTLANQTGWNTQQGMWPEFATQQPPAGNTVTPTDMMADEFSFNVMGHSGKFYWEGSTKQWVVVSNEHIQVQMPGFYTAANIYSAIDQYVTQYNDGTSLQIWPDQYRAFSGFKLIMPDGTQFNFGGLLSNVPDAVEFTSTIPPANNQVPNGSQDQTYTASCWLLKSIVDIYGNTVTFSYTRTYPTCNVLMNYNYWLGTFTNIDCSQTSFVVNTFPQNGSGGGNPVQNLLNANYIWPEYLTSVSSPVVNVNFNMTPQTYNRYPVNDIGYYDLSNGTQQGVQNVRDLTVIGLNNYPNETNFIQWEELTNLTVTDANRNPSINNGQPNILKQYKFNYLNTTTYPNQRLMLGNLQELDRQSNLIGQYGFGYNIDLSLYNKNDGTGAPIYSDGNFSDHWGFYNGLDLTAAYNNANSPSNQNTLFIYTAKQPDKNVVTNELLTSITYPTGGATNLTWESNDYSEIVAPARNAYLTPAQATSQYSITMTGYGGGARIREIKDVLQGGGVARDRTYHYVLGYKNSAAPGSLPSSGVLNGMPQYQFSVDRLGINIGEAVGMSVFSLNGNGNYGYNGQGLPVGYKEVVEVNADGSYTKNLYTSYDADYNGVTHWDQAPAATLGWQSGDFYLPFTSLELERGKPIVQYVYNPSDLPLTQTTYTYRSDAARFNSSLNLVESAGLYNYAIPSAGGGQFCAAGIEFCSARSVYTYDYYPVSKTEVTYDQNSANPLTATELYQYNANNLLSVMTTTNSKGETLQTSYQYPTDLTTAPYTSMAAPNVNMINQVIQQTSVNNAIPTHAYTTTYMSSNGQYVPQYYQEQVGSNTAETREQVNQYDAFGHPLEIQKPNGVLEAYIWGYNSQYLVAKVTGAGYNTAIALVNTTTLNDVGWGNFSNTDADVRTQIANLRKGLPSALVYGYTYTSGVGVSSTIDPQGRVYYYDYDFFSRLIDIRDQDQNVIKRYCYNYTGQTDACAAVGYGNQATPVTGYTSTATCGNGTTDPTINYSIPANTYYAADQTTANNLAKTAAAAQGQALANSLPCLAEVSGTNNTAFAFTATFTNVTTGVVSSAGFYPAYSNTPLLPLPVGNYNLSLTSTTGDAILTFGGNTYSGATISVPNISVTAPITLTLQPDNAGPCAITTASGFSSPSKGITNNGSTVSFYIAFYTNSSLAPGVSYYVANIQGACMPSAVRTVSTTSQGRNWLVTIYPSGAVYWQMTSGSTLSPNATVGGNTLTYSH